MSAYTMLAAATYSNFKSKVVLFGPAAVTCAVRSVVSGFDIFAGSSCLGIRATLDLRNTDEEQQDLIIVFGPAR